MINIKLTMRILAPSLLVAGLPRYGNAQNPPTPLVERPFGILRVDPALDELLAPDGDADGKSLYVTACTALYRIRLKVPGVMPGQAYSTHVN